MKDWETLPKLNRTTAGRNEKTRAPVSIADVIPRLASSLAVIREVTRLISLMLHLRIPRYNMT